jgi:diguanylate cyclase (GGDEF)-like protein
MHETRSQLLIQSLRRYLVYVVAVVFAGLLIATVMLLNSNREDQINRVSHTLKNMSVILSKESDATFALADNTLESLTWSFTFTDKHELRNLSSVHKSLMKARKTINARTGQPSFSHLFVVDSNGYSVANTVSYPSKNIYAGDRPYFKHHENPTNDTLHISQPLYSKVTGERVIYLTRRVTNDKSEFCGVIGIQLKLSHFDQFYQLLDIPLGGSVTVLRDDGRGIYRYPLIESFLTQTIADQPVFKQIIKEKAGSLRAKKTPYDGENRIIGFKSSTVYPTVNAVTMTEHSILKDWFSHAIKILSVAGFAAMMLIALTYFTYRQLDSLERTIGESTHDALTRIWNRRAFDMRIKEELNRARRSNTYVSLLFIDIDLFKRYNDCYGHTKGDSCLTRVAARLQKDAARSGEMVARYGGEEFVVLLPDHDENGAKFVAERMLNNVREQNIPHADSNVDNRLTISIGVAGVKVSKDLTQEMLLNLADKALYQAKALGRNQIVCSSAVTPV